MNNSSHMPRMKNTGMVLSDIDGTIVKGSLVLEHAQYAHENGIIDLGELPAQWEADRKNEEIIAELGEAYRNSIKGMTPEDLHAADFINRYVSDDSKFYSTLGHLIEAKKSGYRVVLISGSPSFLVTPFARKFKFQSKGSNYKRDESGAFTGECVGMFGADSKRRHVASLKPHEYARVVAYGDTSSDIPLFEVADHSVLVAPTAITLASTESMVDRVVHA